MQVVTKHFIYGCMWTVKRAAQWKGNQLGVPTSIAPNGPEHVRIVLFTFTNPDPCCLSEPDYEVLGRMFHRLHV